MAVGQGGGELTDTTMPPLALDFLFSKSGCCCRSFPSLPSLYLCLPCLFPTYLKSVHYLFFTSECNVLIIKQVVNTGTHMTTCTACKHHSDCGSETLPAKFKAARNDHIMARTHKEQPLDGV